MTFSIQTGQLVSFTYLFVFGGMIALAVLKRKYRVACILAVLALVLFIVNPIRITHKGGASLEEPGFTTQKELAPRVYVEKKSFEERQRDELRNLEQRSEEIQKNEIHN